ncbi:MAG TPA: hypothetical protein VMX96_06575 [Dehalococcoidia bacterium]|nr:hypothetical protein [Dehalococcoidia bacterium]
MNSISRAGQEWREIGISSGDHLNRMVQMYEELGFEVSLEEVEKVDQQCLECYQNRGEVAYRLYVKSEDRLHR